MPTPQIQNDPIFNLPFLYINGMIASNNVTTPNTVLDISAGRCRDDNDVMDITFGFANVEGSNLTTAPLHLNAAVNGVNGLDTGVFAASSVYAIYAIADSRYYNAPAALLSKSLTAPSMPAGYDSKRLIGFALSDASTHFLSFYISGNNNSRLFSLTNGQSIIGGGVATTLTAVPIGNLIPAIDNTPIWTWTSFVAAAAANTLNLGVTGIVQYCAAVPGATAPLQNQTRFVSKLSAGVPQALYKVSAGAFAIWLIAFEFYI